MTTVSKNKVKLDSKEQRTVAIMNALGDATRFKICKIMLSGREMCVSEIAESVGVSVPAVSQHFRIFELNGMVDKERYGQKICYKLRDEEFIKAFVKLT